MVIGTTLLISPHPPGPGWLLPHAFILRGPTRGPLLVACPIACPFLPSPASLAGVFGASSWMWKGEGRWLHFLPGARAAAGPGREALYKLAMKAVKRDGQGSGWPAPGLWRPWNAGAS